MSDLDPMTGPSAIGPYTVRRRLSHATLSHAEVFEARDREGSRVCLKRIHPNVAADEDFVLRFENELELAETLQHINLVRVVEHGHHDGPYFVMEWVDGVDLHQLLAAERRLPAELVAYLGVELCRALAYVHRSEWTEGERGEQLRTRGPVVHGDLSPSNVLLSRQGFVKLADFGLAHVLGRTGMRVMTEARGKPMYWAPEQFEDEEIGVETDLFALGLVLWRALVGSHPYAEGRPLGGAGTGRRSLNEWIAEQVRAAATARRSVVEAAPDAPPALQRVIEGLLQPRARRIGQAEELFETLRPIEPLDGHARLGVLVTQCMEAAS